MKTFKNLYKNGRLYLTMLTFLSLPVNEEASKVLVAVLLFMLIVAMIGILIALEKMRRVLKPGRIKEQKMVVSKSK